MPKWKLPGLPATWDGQQYEYWRSHLRGCSRQFKVEDTVLLDTSGDAENNEARGERGSQW